MNEHQDDSSAPGTSPPRSLHVAAIAASVGVWLLYLVTLAPSLVVIDSGELAAVAHTFGIAHPTGYPLFTLLAGLWALVPIGSPIFRLNLFSAFCCAASVGVLVEVIYHLTSTPETSTSRSERRRNQRKDKNRSAASTTSATALPHHLRLTVSVFGALVVALSETFWKVALSVEVYSLHMLLMSAVLLAAVRAMPVDGRLLNQRWFALLALLLGLSFSNHLTTIYLVPGLAVAYLWHQGVGASSWRRAATVVPLFAAGLVPYLYLPLRAASGPFLCWGNPTNLERLLWHMSGKQYRQWVFSSTEVAGRQLRYFLSTFPTQLVWVSLVLAAVGLLWLLHHRRRTAVVLLTWFIVAVGYSINYDIHDIDSYFLLAYAVTGIAAAFGLVPLLSSPKWQRPALVGAAATLVLMASVNLPRVSERGNYMVEDYTRNMLDSLEQNAVILSFQWDYWLSASYYLQLVEKYRPDVVVIDSELVRRSHYLAQMARNYPDVWPTSSPALAAFEVELDKFEHDRPYDSQVIDRAYYRLLDTVVESSHQAGRPVYVTLEIGPEIGKGFIRVPEGLAFRLYREWDLQSSTNEIWDDFRYRPFHRRDQYIDGITEATATMLTNRGIFLLRRSRVDEALDYAQRALKIRPDLREAQELEQQCRSAGLH